MPNAYWLLMSYRAFKRLLGETSLERKCRFLFGGFIVLLISGSFWLYAQQTEHLAFEQIVSTCRVVAFQRVHDQITLGCHPLSEEHVPAEDRHKQKKALTEFEQAAEKRWPASLSQYKSWMFKANPGSKEPLADADVHRQH
jgi:two-component system sensor histidine kinase BarA